MLSDRWVEMGAADVAHCESSRDDDEANREAVNLAFLHLCPCNEGQLCRTPAAKTAIWFASKNNQDAINADVDTSWSSYVFFKKEIFHILFDSA